MLEKYVIEGWPERKEQLNEEIKKYWDSKELITVHEDVLYKSNLDFFFILLAVTRHQSSRNSIVHMESWINR